MGNFEDRFFSNLFTLRESEDFLEELGGCTQHQAMGIEFVVPLQYKRHVRVDRIL